MQKVKQYLKKLFFSFGEAMFIVIIINIFNGKNLQIMSYQIFVFLAVYNFVVNTFFNKFFYKNIALTSIIIFIVAAIPSFLVEFIITLLLLPKTDSTRLIYIFICALVIGVIITFLICILLQVRIKAINKRLEQINKSDK